MLVLQPEHAPRRQFFRVISNDAQQAQAAMGRVAQQLHEDPRRAVHLGPVLRQPDARERCARSSPAIGAVSEDANDPTRPALIAHGLDQVSRATERISAIAHEIHLRNKDL
jgi:hypothetical protein